jgi:hypothetical protein
MAARWGAFFPAESSCCTSSFNCSFTDWDAIFPSNTCIAAKVLFFICSSFPVEELAEITPEKGKLAQRNTDHQHTERPEQGNDNNIDGYPGHPVLNNKAFQQHSAQPATGAAAQGKRDENEQKPPSVYVPFLLQVFQHGAKISINDMQHLFKTLCLLVKEKIIFLVKN